MGLILLGFIGLDVLYLNLYKIFCILYGGGGLGMGFIGVKSYLVFFLLGYIEGGVEGFDFVVFVVDFGSVFILLIFWVYIVMMGVDGLVEVIKLVILNVNYVMECLCLYYLIFYCGVNG